MKDYKEMADSVFEKIEIYERKRQKTRKTILKISTGLSSVFILVIAAFLIRNYHNLSLNNESIEMKAVSEARDMVTDLKEETLEMAEGTMQELSKEEDKREWASPLEEMQEKTEVIPERIGEGEDETDTLKEIKSNEKKSDKKSSAFPPELADSTEETEDEIIVNQLEEFNERQEDRVAGEVILNEKDRVSLNKKELLSNYSTNVFPSVPFDLTLQKDSKFSIYKKNNGKGEVYSDLNIISYSNRDYSRTISIEVQSKTIPLSCFKLYQAKNQRSKIKGVEMIIAKNKRQYLIEFMYKNTGFLISTEGLTEKEVIDMVKSLIY